MSQPHEQARVFATARFHRGCPTKYPRRFLGAAQWERQIYFRGLCGALRAFHIRAGFARKHFLIPSTSGFAIQTRCHTNVEPRWAGCFRIFWTKSKTKYIPSDVASGAAAVPSGCAEQMVRRLSDYNEIRAEVGTTAQGPFLS